MLITIGLLLLGLFGLVIGGNITIPPAQRLARRLGISELVIGLTILAVGTSVPEIFTNIISGFHVLEGWSASGIAVGNVVGSSLSLVTFLIGISALFGVLYIKKETLQRDGMFMLFSIVAVLLASLDLKITQSEGIILASLYLGYVYYLLLNEKIVRKSKEPVKKSNVILDLLLVLTGIAIVIIGANFVVENGVIIARLIGVRQMLIGIFIGLGTNLPELAISLNAIFKGSGSLSLGNLLGSAITTPLLALGLGASITGFSILKQTLVFDFAFWLIGSMMVYLLLLNHTNLNNKEAGVLISFFLLFMYLQFIIF